MNISDDPHPGHLETHLPCCRGLSLDPVSMSVTTPRRSTSASPSFNANSRKCGEPRKFARATGIKTERYVTHATRSNTTEQTLTTSQTQNRPAGRSPGELPPPPPRIFFGRDQIIEEVVRSSECLTPTALIGVGGIGKTSIALTVLHNDRVKERFGDHRRFIRCDQFPRASLAHFLRRLSEVIGASIKNPEDLTSLRPFLASEEMLIALDNVESLLDPQRPNAGEIYSAIEELGEFSNISLLITSRISTIPPNYEMLEVPTLPMEAARDTFYRIYKRGEQSDSANDILEKLDFHPLSITLLATVGHQNKWGISRLTKEWKRRRTSLLQTEHNKSLAATIELSLASPMFQNLGPDAREFLGVVAFYPQGVDENNLDWFFPAIPNRAEIFDKFCILSLTHRSEEFITMLAPLRDYLSPKDPLASPLLCMTRDRYFSKLSGPLDSSRQDFGENRWIVSEDVNVEHLLDVLTSIDPCPEHVWCICESFINHLCFHKPRLTALGSKIERLPSDHPLKPWLLSVLLGLVSGIGNLSEYNRLLPEVVKLWRDTGNPCCGAIASLASVRSSSTLKEMTPLVTMMLGIAGALKHIPGQIDGLLDCANLSHQDGQFDAALESASRALALLTEHAPQLSSYRCHYTLGEIHRSKGTTEKAIEHFQAALGLVSSRGSDEEAFRVHYSLAEVFLGEGRFDAANTHIEQAKRCAPDNASSAQATLLQALIWGGEGRFKEAAPELLRATDASLELGPPVIPGLRGMVQEIARVLLEDPPGESDPDGECWALRSCVASRAHYI